MIEAKQRTKRTSQTQRELRTGSKYNIYPDMEEDGIPPVKRYIKTALGQKTFLRLDPTQDQRIIVDGIIVSATDNSRNPVWRYDSEVIELYSDREVRFFESDRGNAIAIDDGSLVEYNGQNFVWSLDYNEDALEFLDNGQNTAALTRTRQGRSNYMLISRQKEDNTAFKFGE